MNNRPEQNDQGPTPEQGIPDAGVDTTLLDEALQADASPTSIDELEQKVLALTDPAMQSLLDEALSPQSSAEADTDALADRIIAATTGDASRDSASTQAGSDATPAVIGRIGPSNWRYAAAAVILLAAGVGLWWSQQPDNTTGPIVDKSNIVKPDTGTTEIKTDEETNLWPETADAGDNEALFDEVTSPVQVVIGKVADDLDNVDPLDGDTIWDDLDAYDEFFSNLELGDATPET